MKCNVVHAKEMTPYYAQIDNKYLYNNNKIISSAKKQFSISKDATNYTNFCISPNNYLNEVEQESLYYSYVDYCTTGAVGSTGSYISTGSGYASYIGSIDTNISCSVGGYSGHILRHYFKLLDFTTPSGGADFSWSCFKFALWNGGSNEVMQITDITLIDTDIYSSEKAKYDSLNKQQQQIDKQTETNSKLEEQLQQNQQQHDEIMNSDINSSDKELPDDSSYQDYTSTEDVLKDSVNKADLNVLDIGIDPQSSSWVWDTLTSLIQSHSIIFGMFISILSIGIIKLALGR